MGALNLSPESKIGIGIASVVTILMLTAFLIGNPGIGIPFPVAESYHVGGFSENLKEIRASGVAYNLVFWYLAGFWAAHWIGVSNEKRND